MSVKLSVLIENRTLSPELQCENGFSAFVEAGGHRILFDTGDSGAFLQNARAMGVEGVDAMTQEEYRKAACDAVRKLGQDVGIPADLKAIVKDEDVQFLAESAFADACRPGNPRDTSVEEIAALYRSMM